MGIVRIADNKRDPARSPSCVGAKGGSNEAALKSLRPGDMVFVEKDYWYENRAYYTSLVGVVATILSSILLYRQVKKN